MQAELDTFIAAGALACIIAGVAIEFGLAAALIFGGIATLAVVVLVRRGS